MGSCVHNSDGATEAGDIGFSGVAERAECVEVISKILSDGEKAYCGKDFCAKGYCVDSVGLDGDMIRTYVQYQEKKVRLADQLNLGV